MTAPDKPTTGADALPVLRSLKELAELVERGERLFVRWSRGPEADLEETAVSTDDLTGVSMPGLSANPLDVEPWWQDRSTELWVARRLHDYSHLPREKGPGVRPWVLVGRVAGRGPDNEPLVRDVEPVGWIDEDVIGQAEREVAEQEERWGPLRRER
ncbi:DUF6098 family protein [Streptomyces justiciae]|uniref:DUF6098 family protein n=1 Tax=Streptomyces justiciae TaxID=2780140 RepID=UPI00187E335D|nr:DUF6098 family protein [Streptomyces justiciae]MBE8469974.1 hypothetical protein [Streptomyces justiciae]MCW8381266.1 DUF6098 family protein [Streptomyces justiciae]